MHCRNVRIQLVSWSNVRVLFLECDLNPAMYELGQPITGFVLDLKWTFLCGMWNYEMGCSLSIHQMHRWRVVAKTSCNLTRANVKKGNTSQSRKQVSVANGTWPYIFVENVPPIFLKGNKNQKYPPQKLYVLLSHNNVTKVKYIIGWPLKTCQTR